MIASMWAYYITLCMNEIIMYNIHINPNFSNQLPLPQKVNKGIREVSAPSLQLDRCLYSLSN